MKCCCHWIILLCTLPAVAAFASSCRADFWALRKDLIEKGNNNSNRKNLKDIVNIINCFTAFPRSVFHIISNSFPFLSILFRQLRAFCEELKGSWPIQAAGLLKSRQRANSFQSMQEFGTTCYNCVQHVATDSQKNTRKTWFQRSDRHEIYHQLAPSFQTWKNLSAPWGPCPL